MAHGQSQEPHPTDAHVYSRETAPSCTRLETILASLLESPCITYSSGLAALHAAYVFLNPKVVSIGGGYHGSHGVLSLHSKLTGAKVLPLDCAPEELSQGDIVHLETPVNPTGEAFEIRKYADKAHSRGAYLLIDSTFGPPGLQDPFLWGADIVMHSGTKYIGGHSDMLCGILASKNEAWVHGLRAERTYLGSITGSLESWLGVRSLRTLAIRVQRQSRNAEEIVARLQEALMGNAVDEDTESARALQCVIARIHHASLQESDKTWLNKQMPNGSTPVFALTMQSEDIARELPSKTALFHHATSLGGVESLMEWRAMSDTTVDRRLIRLSIGIESASDLYQDIVQASKALFKQKKQSLEYEMEVCDALLPLSLHQR